MQLKMITIDCAEPRDLATFWTAALNTKVVSDYEGHFVMLAPWDSAGVALGLQKVPEERTGKNRVHIDLHTEDRLTEVDRLVGLGATILDEQNVPGLSWTVLADPAGNVFCVAGEEH